jgi:large subunit ribosomal protein L33
MLGHPHAGDKRLLAKMAPPSPHREQGFCYTLARAAGWWKHKSALHARPGFCYHFSLPRPAAGHARNPTEGEVMAKSKEARSTVKLKSEASDHCYFTQKNRNNTKERISLRKYDPIVRRHVMYKEASKV